MRSSAATATTRRPSSPTASAPRPRPSGCTASTGSERGETPTMCVCLPTSQAAADRLSAVRRTAAADMTAAVGAALVDLGFADGVFEVALGRRIAGPDEPAIELDGDAVAFDSTGVDEVVYRLAPNPGEPPRAAGPDRVRRRAVHGSRSRSSRSSPRPTRRPRSCSTRSTRGSAAGAPTRSVGASGRWPGATRCCASRTCRRSPRMPTPTSASPSASVTAAPSPRSSGSTARAGSSSSPRCWGVPRPARAGRPARPAQPARRRPRTPRPCRGLARRGRDGRLTPGTDDRQHDGRQIDPRRRHRRLSRLPLRRARARAGDDPRLPRRPR